MTTSLVSILTTALLLCGYGYFDQAEKERDALAQDVSDIKRYIKSSEEYEYTKSDAYKTYSRLCREYAADAALLKYPKISIQVHKTGMGVSR